MIINKQNIKGYRNYPNEIKNENEIYTDKTVDELFYNGNTNYPLFSIVDDMIVFDVSLQELDDAIKAQEVKEFQAEFRAERDRLLVDVVDHYQKPLVWEGLTEEQQQLVRDYRQALLDSTEDWIEVPALNI